MELKRIALKKVPEGSSLAIEHPVLDRVLRSRGVGSLEEMNYALDQLLPYHALSNIHEAAVLLADTLMRQEKILIVGDFDADGATSTALSLRVLRAFGATQLDYLVPNRFDFGYGLTPELVALAQTLRPSLIMTVDNGISSHAGVEAAKALNIRVLVTDHHLSGPTLPAADVIVNPNQVGDKFESKALAGVGVVFYVMLAVRAELRRRDWFRSQHIVEPNLADFLDIVALGTVADVVPLDRNNRLLVAQGLKRIQAGKTVPGIAALLTLAHRSLPRVTAADLGFAVGPRLNAAGRMDDMSLGIECLLAQTPEAAMTYAKALDDFNESRKEVERDMQVQAMEIVKNITDYARQALPLGLCLFDERWHLGVIGIVASRIKDKTHRPVIAFAKDKENILKGSVRSIPGVHIRDILVAVDARYPGLILKFGGHAMAAGLSLLEKDFKHFTKVFNEVLQQFVDPLLLERIVETDGELSSEDLSLRFAEMVQALGPWGQHFPEPLFSGEFDVLDEQILAGKYLKLALKLKEGDKVFEAIAFQVDIEQWLKNRGMRIFAVYRLDINEFRERRKLQLIIEQIEVIHEVS